MEENTVYIIQELPGTRAGNPKFNIMGAQINLFEKGAIDES